MRVRVPRPSVISMISTTSTRPLPAASRAFDTPVSASTRFETMMVLLSAWILGGSYLDAWAHRHASRLETFFTPWHAVLYTGVLVTGTFLFVNLLRGRGAGRSWRTALPVGYGLSFGGFVLFGVGGFLDLGWHTVFGIERSYAATLSPTHLILMGSALLMVSGGLRAALSEGRARLGYAGLLSASFVLAILMFFSQDLHPFTSQWSAIGTPPWLLNDQGEELGVIEVILQSAFLMGVVLFLVSRFSLPPGALTILLTLTTAAVVVIWKPDPVVIVGVAGGLFGDGLLAILRPAATRRLALRGFAFLMPSAMYLLYFLGILRMDGIWWPVHAWTGAVAVAGLTGLLLSYLAVPPAAAKDRERLSRLGAWCPLAVGLAAHEERGAGDDEGGKHQRQDDDVSRRVEQHHPAVVLRSGEDDAAGEVDDIAHR